MDKEKIGGVDSIGFMLIPSGSNSMHTKKNHILSYFFESWWVQSKESGKFTQGCDNYWDESNFFPFQSDSIQWIGLSWVGLFCKKTKKKLVLVWVLVDKFSTCVPTQPTHVINSLKIISILKVLA